MTDHQAEPLEVETHRTPGVTRPPRPASALATSIGTWLMAVGFAGLLAWVWSVWRAVDFLRSADRGDFISGPVFVQTEGDVSFTDYADAMTQTASLLMFAAAVVGIGAIVRVLGAAGRG